MVVSPKPDGGKVTPADPAGLLALGLGGDEGDAAEFDLGEFMCARPDLELLGCLGRGGMGVVYRARQIPLDRDVAIKLMSPKLIEDPEFAERFEREARAMARLDHPGIVRVHDFGQAAGVYYFVMELVDGPNLRELISREVDTAKIIEIVEQLCEALAYAHDRGVVHRDIKPENVLVANDGRIKIADFGLAKLHDPAPRGTTMQTRRILGTPQYMAPEQLNDPDGVDHRSDIFALGVVFYELLTGQLPVGRFLSPSEMGHGDSALDAIVLRALESSLERRYQTADEMRRAIAKLGPTDARGESASTPARGRALWRPAAALVAGIALTAGVAIIVDSDESEESASMTEAPASDLETEAAIAAVPVAVSDTSNDDETEARPPPQLNRWPASELALLDSATIGVIGLDWSELRQAPVMREIQDAGKLQTIAPDCERSLLDRTHKAIIAIGPDRKQSEIIVHGDWTVEEFEACKRLSAEVDLDDTLHLPKGGEFQPPSGPDGRLASFSFGSPNGEVFGLSAAVGDSGYTIAERDGRIIISTLEKDADSLAERLERPPTNLALRDAVLSGVDVAAPAWVHVDGDGLPLGVRRLAGEFDVWERVGADVRVWFPDEQQAAAGAMLARGLIDGVSANGQPGPEIEIEQRGARVHLTTSFEWPKPGDEQLDLVGELHVPTAEADMGG